MLRDRYERIHDYLRISVTERCNLRCTYCMPAEGVTLKPADVILTPEEIEALARIFFHLGVRRIRITGGEPLIRNDIDTIFSKLGKIEGLEDLTLSTNATHLEAKLPSLFRSGVRHINVSLDTLRQERFERITRRANFSGVIHALKAAAGFNGFQSIKINAVIMRGVNDDELLDFIHFAQELTQIAKDARVNAESLPHIETRFIEYMPFPGNHWKESDCVSYKEMFDKIEAIYTLEHYEQTGVRGPAKSFRVRETDGFIGFITSVTDNFCGDCNRLRLTSDGMLRTCLFGTDTVNLRELLRSGASEKVMADAIQGALYAKWERHPDSQQLIQINDRDMVAIGG
jgi:molybdenum cofactor biosynthesis protein A